VVQPGAVFLAGATGQPILPYHIESDRHWTLKSWDRTQIPKPFANVALVIGAPILVEDTQQDTLDLGRADLEAALAALEGEARHLVQTPRHSS
jgi:lysophospholipid acyltransferase (LPLAT)-like uncharacterized protein